MLESLFNKVDEETPTRVFFSEYCEIFKNSLIVQFWASADLLLLTKNTIWDGFY